ncbi:MAG: methyltransferase family protein [Thermoanaerobaculia bacterium]
MTRIPWWKGSRGEWYVVAQLAFIVLVFLGPRTWPGSTAGDIPFFRLGLLVGAALVLLGGLLFSGALITLGPNLTPLPHPKADGVLIRTGPYRLVRHPVYCGGILVSFGWALLVHSWLTLLYAAALLVFLDVKSRREERWLKEKFAAYEDYQRQVRKLVPFLY